MTTELQQAMNLIDIQADRLVEISMQTEDKAEATWIQEYAEQLMELSAEKWKVLKRIEVK